VALEEAAHVGEAGVSFSEIYSQYRRLVDSRTKLQERKANIDLEAKLATYHPQVYTEERREEIRKEYPAVNAELGRVVKEIDSLFVDFPELHAYLEAKERGQTNGDGKRHPPPPSEDKLPPGVTVDDVESWRTLAQEREEEQGPSVEHLGDSSPPAVVWQGPFATASEALGLQTWPVWGALYATFSAYAGKWLTLHHYQSDYHGMSYVGIVGRTGRGKHLVPEVVKAAAHVTFAAGDTRQLYMRGPGSAPALGYMIAKYDRDHKTKNVLKESIRATPALCVVPELGTLIAAAASTLAYNPLAESMNQLYDGDGYANLLTDNPRGGGGQLVVPDAELSLVGTTVRERFQETLTPNLLAIGWLSRFLFLPLPEEGFIWNDAEARLVNLRALKEQYATLYPDCSFWLPQGELFVKLLEPDAREYFQSLHGYFNTIFEEKHPAFSRHHMHFQKIAGLLAWYRIGFARKEGRQIEETITRAELQAAEAVVRVAERFTRSLLETSVVSDPDTPQWKRFEYRQIEKVREVLQRISQPFSSRQLFDRVRRHVPLRRDLTGILNALADNGEVDVLLTKEKKDDRGALYWLKNRPYPKREEL
jgi:hypothetical protein